MELVIASTNYGKIKEYKHFFEHYGFTIRGMEGVGFTEILPESGQTYKENALFKAREVSRFCKRLVVADDSGLEVDMLKGEPGVLSARYGDPSWTDSHRNQYILKQLGDIPPENRTARFVCAIAIVDVERKIEHVVTGACKGYIHHEERGTKGFGYDPIFYLPDYQKTFAELEPDVKTRISHRGKAMEKALTILETYR